MNELKPCPFCGSEPEPATSRGETLVKCDGDDCPIGDLWVGLADWNTRAAPKQEEHLPHLYVGSEKAEGNKLERRVLPVTRVEKYKDGFIAVVDEKLVSVGERK